jgi:DNA-3-methyladenine glycosylase
VPAYPRDLLAGNTLAAARDLLGARLVRQDVSGVRVGRIVEVEAYIGTGDKASHARFGPTKRNAVMFGPPGHAYVYLVYGMYDCLNVVTEPRGSAAAVLVRSIEPLEGVDLMRHAREEWVVARAGRRGSGRESAARFEAARRRVAALAAARLASGPGLVCAAFSIGRGDDGADLCDPAASLHLELARPYDPVLEPALGPRIGIGYAPEPWLSRPWRIWARGNPSVSGPEAKR